MNKPLLQLSDVTKSFGGIKALSGLCCEVRQGQIVGVIGPNGAGKTTLVNCLTGFQRPTEGKVSLDGEVSDKARAAFALDSGAPEFPPARAFRNPACNREAL